MMLTLSKMLQEWEGWKTSWLTFQVLVHAFRFLFRPFGKLIDYFSISFPPEKKVFSQQSKGGKKPHETSAERKFFSASNQFFRLLFPRETIFDGEPGNEARPCLRIDSRSPTEEPSGNCRSFSSLPFLLFSSSFSPLYFIRDGARGREGFWFCRGPLLRSLLGFRKLQTSRAYI